MRFFVAHVACLVLCSGASEASTQAESEACVPGAWGEWSACTKTCGGGSQTNKRKGQCTKKGVPWLAQRNCNTGVCKMDCESIWVSDGANPRTEGRYDFGYTDSESKLPVYVKGKVGDPNSLLIFFFKDDVDVKFRGDAGGISTYHTVSGWAVGSILQGKVTLLSPGAEQKRPTDCKNWFRQQVDKSFTGVHVQLSCTPPTAHAPPTPSPAESHDCKPGNYREIWGGQVLCAPCAEGTFGLGGLSPCVRCNKPGKYSPTAGSVDCEFCPRGKFPSRSRADCEHCQAGWHQCLHTASTHLMNHPSVQVTTRT